jgi:hypothetical protein
MRLVVLPRIAAVRLILVDDLAAVLDEPVPFLIFRVANTPSPLDPRIGVPRTALTTDLRSG